MQRRRPGRRDGRARRRASARARGRRARPASAARPAESFSPRRPHRREAARRRPSRRPRRRRRTRPGCRRRCCRDRPARSRRRRRRRPGARRSGGRSRAPSRASSASGATPDCSQAKKLPVRPTPHCTSSKRRSAPCSSASDPRGREELRARRVDSALALDRLEQDHGGVRADRGGERLDVVQLGEARGRRERLPGRALAGLARHGERAVRAAVERALERDGDRPARHLPRPLQPRLDGLGARVAEERPRAAEASRRAGRRAGASAPSSRGSTCARASRAAGARRRAAPDDSGRARRRRSRRAGRGSGGRRRRSATCPGRTRR